MFGYTSGLLVEKISTDASFTGFLSIIKYINAMKKQFLILALTLAALLQGCIVKSLHPFYASTDLVYKKELINTWIDEDGNKWTIHPVDVANTSGVAEPRAYEMTCTKEGKSAAFLAHLFELEGNLFLDFRPLASDGSTVELFEMHLLPSHSVAKVAKLTDDVVEIIWFNEKWLNRLFSQNRIKISHEVIVEENSGNDEDRTYVLTASTEELRKFLVKYGNDESAFEGENTIGIKLKRSI